MSKKYILLIIAIVTTLMFTGCSKEAKPEDTPQSVSLILGINENFPQVNFHSEVISDSVRDAAYSYGSVSAIIADGNPYVGSDFNIQKPRERIDNAKRILVVDDNTKQILTQMSGLIPKTSEIDLLSAIDLGADMLHAKEEGTQLQMNIMASGLCTKGLLDMTRKNIVDEPVENLIVQLKEIHALPDLTGIRILWIGFGQVAGRQENLTANYEYKLKERWEAILMEAGAESVKFDSTPLAEAECAQAYPVCSVVPIVEEVLNITSITETYMPEIVKWDGNSNIRFKTDEANFIDENAVKEELMPVAAYLAANPEETIYVFGMTATVPQLNAGKKLSLERAEAVKELLVLQGADHGQILCYGLGQSEHLLRINDTDARGNQIEELAQKNRAVLLMKGDSETVEQLLNSLGSVS